LAKVGNFEGARRWAICKLEVALMVIYLLVVEKKDVD